MGLKKGVFLVIINLLFILLAIDVKISYADQPVSIYLDGSKVQCSSDEGAIIKNGAVFIPIKSVLEEMGAGVYWDGKNERVNVVYNGISIVCQINSNVVKVNGKIYHIDAPLFIHNGRTVASVQLLSKALGIEVIFDEAVHIFTAGSNEANIAASKSREAAIKIGEPVIKDIGYSDGILCISWMDDDGSLWGVRYPHVIVKSTDYGDTWTDVLDAAPYLKENEIMGLYALMISDTGRIVAATNLGRVLVSDEGKQKFSEGFQFVAGYTPLQWGYEKHKNIMLLGSYARHNHNGANPPREVYMSVNSGLSWKKIFDMPIEKMNDPGIFHIHDVSYDPYSKLIWVVTGDGPLDMQIYVSQDLGATWSAILTGHSLHPTSILPFNHGVIFGSDEMPEGLRYWPRPSDGSISCLNEGNIIVNYKVMDEKSKINAGFFTNGWSVQNKDISVALMPYQVQGDSPNKTGYSTLFASTNGMYWQEVFKDTNHNNKGFYNILGPHPSDPNRYIIGTYDRDGIIFMWRASTS